MNMLGHLDRWGCRFRRLG